MKLTTFFVGLVTLIVGAAISVSMLLTYEYLRADKLDDARDMLFLELEHQAELLSAHLDPIAKSIHEIDSSVELFEHAEIILSMNQAGKWNPIKGPLTDDVSAEQLGLLPEEFRGSTTLLTNIAGRTYLIRSRASRLGDTIIYFWGIPSLSSFGANQKTQSGLHSYLMNRNGRVLFSDIKGSDTDILRRPVVQSFINFPLRKGFVGDPDQDITMSFFSEVPGTNLVLFTEVSSKVVLEEVNVVLTELAKQGAIVTVATFFFALLCVWPVRSSLRSLAGQIEALASGQNITLHKKVGFHELGMLHRALASISGSLAEREQGLISLLEKRYSDSLMTIEDGCLNDVMGRKDGTSSVMIGNLSVLIRDGIGATNHCSQIIATSDRNHSSLIFLATEMESKGRTETAISLSLATMFRSQFQNCDYVTDPESVLHRWDRYLRLNYAHGPSVACQIVVINVEEETIDAYNAGFHHSIDDSDGLPEDQTSPLNSTEEAEVAIHRRTIKTKDWDLFLYSSVDSSGQEKEIEKSLHQEAMLKEVKVVEEGRKQKKQTDDESSAVETSLPCFAAVRRVS